MNGMPPTGVDRFAESHVDISIPQSGSGLQRLSLTWNQVAYLRSRLQQLEVAAAGGYRYPSGGVLAAVYDIEVQVHGNEIVIRAHEQRVDMPSDQVSLLCEGLTTLMNIVCVPSTGHHH